MKTEEIKKNNISFDGSELLVQPTPESNIAAFPNLHQDSKPHLEQLITNCFNLINKEK